MYLAHYILPLIVFYFYRDKIMLWGLLLGNLVDLDHLWARIIGDAPWLASACSNGFGHQCSFGTYFFHSNSFLLLFILLGGFIFSKNKKIQFIGWLSLGAALNLILDYLHLFIGFGI